MYRGFKRFTRLILPFALIALSFGLIQVGLPHVAAQEGISVGENKTGEVSAATPQPSYSFSGVAGQEITVQVLALTQGFAPQLVLLNAGGAVVASADNSGNASQVNTQVTLPESGAYTLVVSGTNNSTGQFVISLSGDLPSTPLGIGEAVGAEIESGASQRYSFENPSEIVLRLIIRDIEGPSGALMLSLAHGNGQQLGELGPYFTGLSLDLIPLPGGYVAEVTNTADGGALYVIELQAVSTSSAEPIATEEAAPPVPSDSSGACTVSTAQNSNVNVRSGPGQSFDTIGQISPNNAYNVLGRNEANSWYYINYGAGNGWVAASVTRTNGNCSSLEVIQASAPLPTAVPGQPTATPQPTTAPGQPTNTPTTPPTLAPTVEPGQPTYTPTAPPTEPPPPTLAPTEPPPPTQAGPGNAPIVGHRQFDLNVGSPLQITGQLSYPEGNTDDTFTVFGRGFTSVVFNGNWTVTMVCNGTGVDNIRWGTGQGGGLRCGGSNNLLMTRDSNQQRYTITFAGGSSPSLVNYTLVFTPN